MVVETWEKRNLYGPGRGKLKELGWVLNQHHHFDFGNLRGVVDHIIVGQMKNSRIVWNCATILPRWQQKCFLPEHTGLSVYL